MSVLEAAAELLAQSQQVLQGRTDEGASVCFVAIAPFVLGAVVVGFGSLRRALRARFAQG